MHVTWMMGAARILAENRDKWHGTVMVVFQPGEETAEGAHAMIGDGMVKRFPKPDVTLAQHVMPLSAGQIGYRVGTILSAGDSWEVKLFGRGAHGSMPEKSIDPVVMAASAVMRLQTVVSREVAMTDNAVLSVGTMHAGNSDNVIPDQALLRLNVRTFKDQVRERVLSAIKRILDAEAAASGAPKPPEYTVLGEWPMTRNDEAATRKVATALEARFGAEHMQELPAPFAASEDFNLFGAAWGVPAVFWVVGGIEPDTYAKAEKAGKLNELPVNHSPEFAPVINPTLRVGIEAMLAAASVWLVGEGA